MKFINSYYENFYKLFKIIILIIVMDIYKNKYFKYKNKYLNNKYNLENVNKKIMYGGFFSYKISLPKDINHIYTSHIRNEKLYKELKYNIFQLSNSINIKDNELIIYKKYIKYGLNQYKLYEYINTLYTGILLKNNIINNFYLSQIEILKEYDERYEIYNKNKDNQTKNDLIQYIKLNYINIVLIILIAIYNNLINFNKLSKCITEQNTIFFILKIFSNNTNNNCYLEYKNYMDSNKEIFDSIINELRYPIQNLDKLTQGDFDKLITFDKLLA